MLLKRTVVVLSVLMLVVGLSLPVHAQPKRSYDFAEFEPEVTKAFREGGKDGVNQVMKKYGWVPMNLELEKIESDGPSAPASGDVGIMTGVPSVEPYDLNLHMYGWRNDRNISQFAVYGEYQWADMKCIPVDKQGSYDVMGLDWNTDNLTLLGVQSSDGGITYRGEKPFQRSVIFNVHDPVPSGPYCLFMGNPSTGWIVMDTPNVAGTTYQFNLKFDHTYMTSSWSGEWSAGVTWDDSIKGNASYKVTLKENETKWSKGAFYSCVWPCG